MDSAAEFLHAIHGQADNGWMLVWTNDGKTSAWFPVGETAAAATYAAKLPGNAYFGVGLSPRNFGPKKRCPAGQIVSIPGLWLDLDIGQDGHKGKRYPPTMEDAAAVLAEMPAQPTLTVHTGNGLHCYWLFREPWTFDTAEERAQAAALVEAWQALARATAKRLGGWDVDATHDIARVLRVPGTLNRKDPANPKPVRVVSHDDARRFNPSELADLARDHMPEAAAPLLAEPTREEAQAPPLSVDPAAALRWLEGVRDIDPKIDLAWRAKRQDIADRSLSGQLMAFVAGIAANDPDNETKEEFLRFAVAEFYRRHGDTPEKQRKGERLDIQNLVIHKARNNNKLHRAGEVAKRVLADHGEQRRAAVVTEGGEAVKAMDKETKPQILDALTAQFGFRVLGVKKYSGDPPTFSLVTNLGVVELGPPETFASQAKFRARIMGVASVVIPKMKASEFDDVLTAMLSAAELVDLGPEASDAGILREEVRRYLLQNRCTHDVEGALVGNLAAPIMHNGCIYFRLADLREYLARCRSPYAGKELAKLLTQSGFVREGIKITIEGRRTERSAWRAPADLVPAVVPATAAANANPWGEVAD